jgi:coenzyme PQQ precursor peptide PqqA
MNNPNGVKHMWKTPSVREISVGMEINLYVCATL